MFNVLPVGLLMKIKGCKKGPFNILLFKPFLHLFIAIKPCKNSAVYGQGRVLAQRDELSPEFVLAFHFGGPATCIAKLG